MARTTRPTQTPPARGRPPARAASRAAPPAAKAAAAKPRGAAAAVVKPSKDELRAQVEKLERANAVLRAKGREATRVARTATGRIAELEEQVTGLESRLARAAGPAKRGRAAASPPPEPEPEPEPDAPAPRQRRRRREIDPGDAVPEGVAVAEPEPLDEEAQTARDNLDEHLG